MSMARAIMNRDPTMKGNDCHSIRNKPHEVGKWLETARCRVEEFESLVSALKGERSMEGDRPGNYSH